MVLKRRLERGGPLLKRQRRPQGFGVKSGDFRGEKQQIWVILRLKIVNLGVGEENLGV